MTVQMHVITFPPLVVEAHNPNAVLDKDHAIFKPVLGWGYRRRNLPDNELDNAAVRANALVFRNL